MRCSRCYRSFPLRLWQRANETSNECIYRINRFYGNNVYLRIVTKVTCHLENVLGFQKTLTWGKSAWKFCWHVAEVSVGMARTITPKACISYTLPEFSWSQYLITRQLVEMRTRPSANYLFHRSDSHFDLLHSCWFRFRPFKTSDISYFLSSFFFFLNLTVFLHRDLTFTVVHVSLFLIFVLKSFIH